MNKQKFITLSLLVSALAFNPLIAQQLYINTSLHIKRNSVKSNIASILQNRGLDEDVAKEFSENLVHDDELFATMIDNLLHGYKDLHQDEIFEYLSQAALHRNDVHLDNYGHLLHTVSTIKQKVLDKSTLAQLNVISKQNASLIS